jgi:cytochrome c5
VTTDPRYVSGVEERLKPVAAIAVAGQDNSALTIQSTGPEINVSLPADGTAAYDTGCVACHGAGIAGAPKVGDKGAWGPRIAQGKATLYKHAIEGFNGKTGVMPPKGGQVSWPDDLVKQAVDHIIELNR